MEVDVESRRQAVRILLIDDDLKLGRLLGGYLEPHGYELTQAGNGEDGIALARSQDWQLILLDLMLPDIDGFEVLRRLRALPGGDVLVMMLTARGDEADRIVGLEIGADDYVPKISSSRELLARIRAVLRRGGSPAPSSEPERDGDRLVRGALRVDLGTHRALLGERELRLTPIEFALLATLARARGKVCTREQLVDEASASNIALSARSIDVHISMLRRKLGEDTDTVDSSRYIRTTRGVGFALLVPKPPKRG